MNETIKFTYRGLRLKYNPETGECWRAERCSWRLVNPGTDSRGYTQLKISGKVFTLHRVLAEVFLNGGNPIPENLIVDHREQIDGSHAQDRLSNLRLCSHADNSHNARRGRRNSSGYKGVSFNKPQGKWLAHIAVNGRSKHLGSFTTPEEAAAAYDFAANYLYGEFAHTN